MFLFGNAYSVLLKPPLIVLLLFFLLKVLHCNSGVFSSNFFCDPVIRIFGERWTGGSAFCFPSFLSSFAERFLEIFDLVLGQVQKGCFLVVVASALTSISSMSKHRTLRTVWDQSSSDSRRTSTDVKPRFSTTNSDFQLRFSKTNFHFQTPILKNKLPFSKTYSHFQKQTPLFKLPIFENKLQFFKANFDFPIQFFENKLRFSTN